MDVASSYNQHANAARRKNRSSTNLSHLTLAPLTSKFPLQDDDDDIIPDGTLSQRSTSYLQGRSAPTTPRLLSRSPLSASRSSSRPRGTSASGGGARTLPKSKSATHLTVITGGRHNTVSSNGHNHRHSTSVNTSPISRRRGHRGGVGDDPDRNDSDWLLRAGALISTETRESKGQAWLVSRASSTSLAGMHDAEEEAFERELARERELASRIASRRGSVDEHHHHFAHHSHGHGHVSYPNSHYSPTQSRFGSRSASRVGSRSQLVTPSDRRSLDGGGYFSMTPAVIGDDDEVVASPSLAGPDFVNLDERLEGVGGADDDDGVMDANMDEAEAHVRRLVKRGHAGVGAWFGNLVPQLFAVEEDEEEEDDESSSDDGDGDDEATEGDSSEEGGRRSLSSVSRRGGQFEGITTSLVNPTERMPPPKPDEGGWHDAAWLLTVASKVLL